MSEPSHADVLLADLAMMAKERPEVFAHLMGEMFTSFAHTRRAVTMRGAAGPEHFTVIYEPCAEMGVGPSRVSWLKVPGSAVHKTVGNLKQMEDNETLVRLLPGDRTIELRWLSGAYARHTSLPAPT